jgi:hypothetical protein
MRIVIIIAAIILIIPTAVWASQSHQKPMAALAKAKTGAERAAPKRMCEPMYFRLVPDGEGPPLGPIPKGKCRLRENN